MTSRAERLASRWPLVGGMVLVLGVGCGGADDEPSFCLYEAATCHGASSELVGDRIINIASTCPPGPSDFETNCIDVGRAGRCPSLDATRTSFVDGDTFETTQKNVRLIRGGTCGDWKANPGHFNGAPSPTTSSPSPNGAAGSAGATVSGGGGGKAGGGGGPASAGSAGGPAPTGSGGATVTANACSPRSTDTPCTTCFKGSCCDVFSACAANQACLTIVQCAAKCTDDPCLQACVPGNEAGVAPFNAMSSCADANCASECTG